MQTFDNMEINAGGKFLRVKGGETVDIHILDQHPIKKVVHWINEQKSDCGGNVCLDCSEGVPQQERWLTNVWDRKEKKVKIFEFGAMVAIGIRNIAKLLAEDGHTIHSVDLRIIATGSGKSTKYQVLQKVSAGDLPDDLQLHKLQ
jgi:hypothetical protein